MIKLLREINDNFWNFVNNKTDDFVTILMLIFFLIVVLFA